MDGFAYLDIARRGAENMAIDRRLLEAAERSRIGLLRIYRWSEPTLSLGHFQSAADRAGHPASIGLPSVQRASGGGAIVHDREWTYAVAMPLSRQQVGAATQLYDSVHDVLVSQLRELGWDAAKWTSACSSGKPEVRIQPPAASQPFLCFARRSCGDIVCSDPDRGQWKVVGSAQRRLGTSVLQHGSILCQASSHAPELLGLADLAQNQPIRTENSALESETFGKTVLSWILGALTNRFGISFQITDCLDESLWDG